MASASPGTDTATATRTILIIPTWHLVDSRVVGYQVVALAPHATVVTYDPRSAGASDRPLDRLRLHPTTRPMRWPSWTPRASGAPRCSRLPGSVRGPSCWRPRIRSAWSASP